LWLYWLVRVVFSTIVLAILFASLFTLFLYIKEGLPTFNSQIAKALLDIWKFWFSISLNITLLIALFRTLKYIFNKPYFGYMLKLKKCYKEKGSGYIEVIGYGDLVKVWRKWFMLLIWLVGSFMVLALIVSTLFSSYQNLFDWFNIYMLYIFIFLAAYFSFILLANRCKNVKVVKC
jgi:hypothetical protein